MTDPRFNRAWNQHPDRRPAGVSIHKSGGFACFLVVAMGWFLLMVSILSALYLYDRFG